MQRSRQLTLRKGRMVAFDDMVDFQPFLTDDDYYFRTDEEAIPLRDMKIVVTVTSLGDA